jgi:uncharacterized protein YdaU (DUF1376 family)
VSDTPDVSIFMSTHLGDRLRETGDLSPAEYGSHIRLCEAAWMRGGHLPAEPARLCRLAGAAPGDWPSIWAAIAPLWTASGDGTIYHAPTLAQIDRARAAKASLSERGKKGREAQLAGAKPTPAQPDASNGPATAQPDAGHPNSELRTPISGDRTPNTEHLDPSWPPGGDRVSGGYSDSFVRFWTGWPKKVKKEGAWRVWRSQRCEAHLDAILSALAWQNTSPKWMDHGGQYIPHPDKYLRGKLWEDEPGGYTSTTPARDVRFGRVGAEEIHHSATTGEVQLP